MTTTVVPSMGFGQHFGHRMISRIIDNLVTYFNYHKLNIMIYKESFYLIVGIKGISSKTYLHPLAQLIVFPQHADNRTGLKGKLWVQVKKISGVDRDFGASE
jgi:hypothetical protein